MATPPFPFPGRRVDTLLCALAAACDGGSSDAQVVPGVARNPAVRLARYLDVNDDGIANQGDHLIVVFGELILLGGATPEDFVVPVAGRLPGRRPLLKTGTPVSSHRQRKKLA